MLECMLQLFVFLALVSIGQFHLDVRITDKKQAASLQGSTEHHVIYPYVVDSEGNFISHDIHHHRTRRSSESPEVHYHVPYKNEKLHLDLRPNDRLMISSLQVEWRSGKRSEARRDCHFIGSVRNYSASLVAVSNCKGLAGLIRTHHTREFFIEPVLGMEPSDGKHAHVIYRRSVEKKLDKNFTEPACGVTVEDVQDRDYVEEEPREEKQGFYARRRSRRSVSLMKHVELLLVADYSMTKYYHDRDLETYLFTIMNMLSMVFKHRSIGSAINVVLVRMIILDKENEPGLKVTNHARRSLNGFCDWVQKNSPASDLDPQHADAAVLVTRRDICRDSYKPCETLGLSNMDGMCTAGKECSYNQDTGFTVVYTIAHELGHNLGALHDDDYSSCAELREHIMASNLVITPSEQLWSKCSKKAIKSFFYKGWGWCLNDQPGIDLQPKLRRRMLPGERFDADAQCKMLFGNKSTICSGTETSLCSTLWCVHNTGHCATKPGFQGKKSGFRALDGTPCGKTKNQWCLSGKCVTRVALREPVDGSWGGWSGWSACSRSCGRGVRRRTRKCNNPRPEHGGFYCVGEWKRHSICNVQTCPPGSVNPVQIQCNKFRALRIGGKRYDWAAKPNHRNPCELRCVPVLKHGRSRIRKFIQAQDGTPCNHGTRNICIQGKCEHVGCDEKLYSSAREDRCGVCRGDGSTCVTKHETFDQETGDGYTEALVIPAHSRNIIIQEAPGSPNFIALRSPSGHYYLNGNWYIQWSGEYEVAGASGHYSRQHNRETFRTKGPITEDLHVLLLYQGKNTGLKAQYDVKLSGRVKSRHFYWKYGAWTPCSVTCGQGVQKRHVQCVDQENNVVDKVHCRHKFRYRKRICKRKECAPSWWVGVWHECSKTCGQAVKFRAVLCTQVILDRRKILDEKKCEGKKPEFSISCNQPLCWTVHPWSNCSSLCGSGFQHRSVECPGGDPSKCDILTKPETNRPCEGNACLQWRVGVWSECSVSCGNGTQIRSVSCEHRDENMCRREEKPRANQTCPYVPCPEWKAGAWGECSVTCGKGVETRNVTCARSHVNFTCSASEKPAMVRSCLRKRCSGWTVGEWSPCSTSCGEGVRERKVVCTFKSCTIATRPKHKEICMIRECPTWELSKWSECSVSCGKGYQYRNVTCSDSNYPCAAKTKPLSVQSCLMPECSIWSFSNWSSCSVSCGAGVRTRSIICNAATQDECSRDIPESEKPCNERPCFMWETGNWSECSTSCGAGIQKRSVRCPSKSCDIQNKPNVTRPCFNPDCAVWVTGHWGACPVKCGEGVQTRQVYCSDDDESECNSIEMPESTRDCFVSRCGAWIVSRWGPCSAKCGLGFAKRNATCMYSDLKNCSNKPETVKICQQGPCSIWSTGQWSPCSVTCNHGFQRRIVSCHGGSCLASTKPLSIKPCKMKSCGSWIPGNWSACSASCGDGTQLRDLRCSDSDPKQCTDPKPVIKRFCNKQKCPYWDIGKWGSCSVSCGNGIQRRNVTCIGGTCSNKKPLEHRSCYSGECTPWGIGDWLPCSRTCGSGYQVRMVYCQVGKCEGWVRPPVVQKCNEVACPHWVASRWSVCSKSCNDGIQIRNVSCNNSHIGDCSEASKPNTTQTCNEGGCSHWVTSQWSDCSKSCNGGIQTRNVSCNNSHMGECFEDSKPSTKQTCNEASCPHWVTGHWSACSKSCNGGIQTRYVSCNNSNIGECLQSERPNRIQKCGQPPCPKWIVGMWSRCSKSCGSGIRTRSVTCKYRNVGECLKKDKPNRIEKCKLVPCPNWIAGEWSTCSKSCDGGTQSRNVACENEHVDKCLKKDKPTTSQACGQQPCPQWTIGEWSKCSKSCDGGTQSRNVTCENEHVGKCLKKDKPTTSQACGQQPCPQWTIGEWSKCSKSCDGGIQTRTVACKNDHIGECKLQTKPISKQTCGEKPCPHWVIGEWSKCSKSCDGGMQSRAVSCNNSHVGVCLSKDKPTTKQTCGALPCPHWIIGAWGKCSKSCNGGFRRREVFCANSNVGECSPVTKPRTMKRCRRISCPEWFVGEWSACSKTCDGGFQTRNISCKNYHVGACDATSKPYNNQTCGDVPCPKWSVGTWSKCSRSCEGGAQTRTVTCENGHIGECPQNEIPSTNQKCSHVPCPKWSVGAWSKCSKSCNNGTQTRNVTCENKHVGECLSRDKPSTYQNCGTLPCPIWTIGAWSKCSKSCDGGIQTRIVVCLNNHVGDCLENDKPATNQTCSEVPCPHWITGLWEPCSKSCGGGLQSRTVTCKYDHVGDCSENDKPAANQTCSEVPCPKWTHGKWSKCSKTCGLAIKHRSVTCRNKHIGECIAKNKPKNTKICHHVPCPLWSAGEWSKCSRSCDGGIQTRKVFCKNNRIGKCMVADKPDSTKKCGDVPCPHWLVGVWSQCSKSCDGGIQIRTVTCNNSHVGNCLIGVKPVSRQNCSEIPCPLWAIGAWSKCSKSCDSGVRTRNVTCKHSHVGACLERNKPNLTEKCGDVPCPKWTVGEWSKCSKSCDGGIQTRNVTCRNNHVGECLVTEKPITKQKCAKVPCPVWIANEWSKCSKSCDGGIQTRSIVCENSHVGECLLKHKPTTLQQCSEVACPTWISGEWSKCSKSCDGGFQTRNVTCLNHDVGACAEDDKPISRQNCSEAPCPEWVVGPWEKCSKSCGGGIKHRPVTCKNSKVGDCLEEDKPKNMKMCHSRPCPIWIAGEWSKCSKSCDGGIQTRTVSCNNVDVGECSEEDKPATNKKCAHVPCPIWTVGEWSKCSKSCGIGIQTRIVTCKNNHVGKCSEKDKPNVNQNCSDASCPQWTVGEWSKCSKSCDGGIQTRTVTCKNGHVGECLETDKPESDQKCADVPCPVWTVGEWSKCSKSCGIGIQTRIVTCKNKHVGKCPEKDKPNVNRNCSDLSCPQWTVGEWSKCSKSCDGGIQTRTVTCKNGHVGKCLAQDKPESNKKCADGPCPIWTVGEWSKCSKSCDFGIQTRTVTCKNNHVGKCSEKDKPNVNQNCSDVPCPQWTVSEWSKCSKSCDGGTQSRSVTCKNSHVGECVTKDKPGTSQTCGNVPCPIWAVGSWSKCSKSCGGGIQSRTISCKNSHAGECLAKDKPISDQKCAEVPCPIWSTGEWSKCSKSCDGGIQTRTVTCENSNVGECSQNERPSTNQKCSEVPCPKWSTGAWSKCTKSCDGGMQTRTVTCKNSHIGDCLKREKPTNSQMCSETPCPKWILGDWGPCSKSCDSGERTRIVRCSDGGKIPCAGRKPAIREVCNEIQCPIWIVGNWTACTTSLRRCPKGRRSRLVECSWKNRRACNRKTKPVSRERCVAECPEWKTGEWSECQGSCKDGIMSRRVWCQGGNRACKLNRKPAVSKPCDRSSCLVWETGDWNVCPVSCGGGLRSRIVHCVNKDTRDLTQGCERGTKPITVQACALHECPSSPDETRPPLRDKCHQAIQDTYFCNLLLRPSLSELCLYKRWRQRCCKSCFRVNAQRKRKK